MSRQHPLRTADYLQHMAQAIDNIQSYTGGMDAASFKVDLDIVWATVTGDLPGMKTQLASLTP